MSNTIRAALERLVRAYDNNEGLPIAEWIATARAALAAEPVGEGPSDEDLIRAYAHAVAAAVDAHPGAFNQEDAQAAQLAGLRAVLARWAHPAAPPAPEVGEAPAAWLYLGEPDFDGTTWRENWRVTTDEQVARFKAQPGCPVPLFRHPATPAAL